jgi:hypothetical protein
MFNRTENLLLRPFWPEESPRLLAAKSAWPFPHVAIEAREAARMTHIGEARLLGLGQGAAQLDLRLLTACTCWSLAREATRALLDMAFEGLRQDIVLVPEAGAAPEWRAILLELGFAPNGCGQLALESWRCPAAAKPEPVAATAGGSARYAA